MKKTLQIWGTLILFLFLFPMFITSFPKGQSPKSSNLVKDSTYMVYASNIMEEETVPELEPEPEPEPEIEIESTSVTEGKALLYFTHFHEAFKPVTQAKEGKVTVSHNTENITKFGEKLKTQLQFNGIETDMLVVEVPHTGAYNSIRPHVEKQMQEKKYDLIIDLHRDSVGPNITTIAYDEDQYAKVAFVIGMEHPNFERNRAKALLLKKEMELLVPGITRDLVMKHGPSVDGKYNQDLDPSLLVVELGGIGNSEDQLNRTVTVLAKAAATVIENSNLVE
ncbi:stage II sporulation protein P [Sporosarcina sp. ANT_H38]|uniref:stage II sporulation protein P n=1 Tax=Sporosarcina sp. ANT_H38 TaxID=2597358 RepID=UPI0011F0E790|nr:stage II sporulation protein P [Sporosarcina sp. ANT_H38]KAA0965421.1 stage II sporulation protein P [Sporosarcina sp. ANT_H38]